MDHPRASSNFCPADEDNTSVNLADVAVCPFNKSHMMKKSRLQYHLVKCMKNYGGTKVPCPYNHTEYFEPEKLIWHLNVCPSRKRVEVQQYNSDKNRNEAIQLKSKLPSAPIQEDNRYSDENWGFD